MSWVGRVGDVVIRRWRTYQRDVGVAVAALCLAVQPRFWPRTVRNVLSRQILFTGIHAIRFTLLGAMLMGVGIVLQATNLLTHIGQSTLVGPVLVSILLRELAPMMVNFIVIGRSGTAIAAEIATMKVSGEIRLLDSQGIEPFTYLMMPRVIATSLSVFCLTLIFIAVSLLSGFAFGRLLDIQPGTFGMFLDTVIGSVKEEDVLNLLGKTLLPGLMTGSICGMSGLQIRGALTDVPQAVTRGVTRSVAAMFVITLVISLLTYL